MKILLFGNSSLVDKQKIKDLLRMRYDKPRDDEVEEENWVNSQSFSVRWLTVAHEDYGS
jgi:hypothetical protein